MNLLTGPALRGAEKSQIGGKALSLNKITENDFNTLNFCVVTTEVFDSVVSQFASQIDILLTKFEKGLIEAASASAEIQAFILSAELSVDLIQCIRLWCLENKAISYAVRSSIVDEDGVNHSFAGQMDSFLFQKSLQDIELSILKVMASAFSERALLYRKNSQISLVDIQAAVIIQRMLEPKASGVLFTCNINQGSLRHFQISGHCGVGEDLVSGHSDADEWVFDSKNKVVQCLKKANKEPCLSDIEVDELCLLSQRLAQKFGKALDIEWALAEGKFYFLQARPVTSGTEQMYLGSELVLDNSNIQESFCGVTLPLTFSYASEAYFQVYSQLMREMSFSKEEIQLHEARHRRMLAYNQGRVFYNIRSWYDGLRFLPSFGRRKEDMEKMMGVEHPVSFVVDNEKSWLGKVKILPRMIWIAVKLGYKFNRLPLLTNKFHLWFTENYRTFSDKDLSCLNSEEILQLIVDAKATFLENWGIPLVNDFFVMTYNGKVQKTLKSLNQSGLLPYLMGGEKIESTEPTKRIYSITVKIRANADALKLFKSNLKAFEILAIIKERHTDIYADFINYIELYGDRVSGELKLETITLKQDPRYLIELLRASVDGILRNVETMEAAELKQRMAAEAQVYLVIQKNFGTLSARVFKAHLQKLRVGVAQRESMRLARTRFFGLMRKFYCALGETWCSAGVLKQARDIFYLTEREIQELVEGRSHLFDLEKVIESRRVEFLNFEKSEPPSHFRVSAPINSNSHLSVPSEPIQADLVGLGCYPGMVEGEVCVVLKPEDVSPSQLNGKILIALRTDPGWAPLFMNIKGLIVEKGSTLSHSAIVARELELPTIVGVNKVTEQIKTGDWICFDGSTGKIEMRNKNEFAQSSGRDRNV